LLSNIVSSIDFVALKDNLVDPFTKGLSGQRINCALNEMGQKPNQTSQLNENFT